MDSKNNNKDKCVKKSTTIYDNGTEVVTYDEKGKEISRKFHEIDPKLSDYGWYYDSEGSLQIPGFRD